MGKGGYNGGSTLICGYDSLRRNRDMKLAYRSAHLNGIENDLEASRTFSKHNITSNISCLVERNSFCAHCQKSVYSYSNKYGRFLDFDEVGPPWIDHRCDMIHIGLQPVDYSENVQIQARSLSDRQSLLRAFRIMNHTNNLRYCPWVPLLVVSDDKIGSENIVNCEVLNSYSKTYFNFKYNGSEKNIEILHFGEIVFLKNYILNFLNTSNMEITTMDIIKPPTKLKKELKISYNSSGISDDL